MAPDFIERLNASA